MDKFVAELAIRALESERQKIDSAIRELRALVTGEPPEAEPAPKKRKMSAAGRKRIVEATKRRWAKVHEAQATAPAKPKKLAAKKKGGMTPEGRARVAEATRQRNLARSAAAKKAPK